jgi:small subunit ribosomal protein S14
MARVSAVQKNNKRIAMVKSFAQKRLALKQAIYDKKIPLEKRFSLIMQLAALPRNSARNRIRNRCHLTGRPRAYNRKIGLSRNMLRDLAGKGMLPGLVKASW